jgi:ribosomal protein S18 acetylase RimI-like enzyme
MATRTVGAFSIRRCTTDDAATVASLAARLFAEAYGPTHPEPELSRYLARSFPVDGIRDAIADEDVTILIAEDSTGTAMAYAYLRASPKAPAGVTGERVFEIFRFYVDASWQGKGIGTTLMEECFEDAKQRGADVIWLQVWKEAPWAVGFYQKMGFTIVGSAQFYFGEQIGQDHVMAMRLRTAD